MGKVYSASIWQSASGIYYVADTDALGRDSGAWWVPARVLDMTPVSFVKWLKDTYKPDIFEWNGKNLLYGWSEKSQANANSFKLYINRISRQKQFTI